MRWTKTFHFLQSQSFSTKIESVNCTQMKAAFRHSKIHIYIYADISRCIILYKQFTTDTCGHWKKKPFFFRIFLVDFYTNVIRIFIMRSKCVANVSDFRWIRCVFSRVPPRPGRSETKQNKKKAIRVYRKVTRRELLRICGLHTSERAVSSTYFRPSAVAPS